MNRFRSITIKGIYSINAAALLLGAAYFLSRVLGVIRDRMLAGQFGAGRELDIYYAAFQIPDFMSTLFLLGAGANAIVPIFQEYFSRDANQARRLISDTVTIFLVGSCIVASIVAVFADVLARVMVPGFSPEDQVRMVVLVRILLLSPILLGISSILSSVVQSFHQFFTYALAPIVYNVGIIIGIVFFLPIFGLKGLAYGVILGALFHVGIQWWSIRRVGFQVQLVWPRFTEGVRHIWQISLPRVFSVSLSQITVVILVALGSTLVTGSITVFQLAQNLYFFPIGIFGASYATAVFPRLSQAYLDRDGAKFFNDLFLSIRSILFWLIPSAVMGIVLRAHIVRVAFGTGLFSWEDTRLTAASFAIFAVIIVGGGLTSLFIKGFYALENTWMPLAINLGTSVLSITAAFFFTQWLSSSTTFIRIVTGFLRISDLPHPQVIGLALGFSVGVLFDAWFLYVALKRRAERIFKECMNFPVIELLRIVSAALAGGIAAYLVRVSFSHAVALSTFIRVLCEGAVVGLVGFLVYASLLFIMGNAEVRALIETFRRRLFTLRILPANWNGDRPLSP